MASEMPKLEDVLAAIDSLPVEWTRPGDGATFVSRHALGQKLFPPGSKLWQRPQGMPHGLDRSPAWTFMDRIGFDFGASIETVNMGARKYYRRRTP